MQEAELSLLQRFNQRHLRAHEPDAPLEARIKSYETAFGMQHSMPNVLDLSKETEATLKLYGLERGQTTGFGWQALVARRMVEHGVRFIELIDVGASKNWDAHSDPFVIDLDGDGSLDLVSGSSDGGIYWAQNKAGKGKVPDLEPFRPLIKPGFPVKPGQPLRESDLTGPTSATRVWVADVNGDGKLDLLVGDCVTLVSPAKGMRDAEFKKKYADWEKAFQAALASLNSARDAKSRKKAAEEYSKVYGQRSAFMREEMTGFVWLYLQK